MNEELAYSIHLGSDKNRTNKAKEIAKTNPSETTSFSNNSIQNANQLSDITELDEVDGIGEVRAKTIVQTLKRMQEQFVFDRMIV